MISACRSSGASRSPPDRRGGLPGRRTPRTSPPGSPGRCSGRLCFVDVVAGIAATHPGLPSSRRGSPDRKLGHDEAQIRGRPSSSDTSRYWPDPHNERRRSAAGCPGRPGSHRPHRQSGPPARWAAALFPQEIEDSGNRHDVEIVSGFLAVRAILAETTQGAIHEAGIDLPDCFIIQSPAAHRSRTEILHEHVGLRDHAPQDRPPLFLVHVEGHASLVAVDHEKETSRIPHLGR